MGTRLTPHPPPGPGMRRPRDVPPTGLSVTGVAANEGKEAAGVDWPIQEIARLANTTSRTLRHYGQLGLLKPSRIGTNGYRYYDDRALIQLQRILMLRELGLGLPAIADVLRDQGEAVPALRTHLRWLRQEQDRLVRQIRAVENTIRAQEEGDQLMAKDMFDGFDHTQYKDEVEQRWGKKTYAAGDRWWRSKTEDEKQAFKDQHLQIARDYAAARETGQAPDSEGCSSDRRTSPGLAQPLRLHNRRAGDVRALRCLRRDVCR